MWLRWSGLNTKKKTFNDMPRQHKEITLNKVFYTSQKYIFKICSGNTSWPAKCVEKNGEREVGSGREFLYPRSAAWHLSLLLLTFVSRDLGITRRRERFELTRLYHFWHCLCLPFDRMPDRLKAFFCNLVINTREDEISHD